MTQQKIDAIAVEMYPKASAVLKHAGIEFTLKRPKGWRDSQRVTWMEKKDAFAMLAAAKKEDAEFGIFLIFLLHTGCRLNEALALTCDRLTISESFAYFPKTKNDDPRAVYLPPYLVVANHPRGLDRGKQRVFRFRKRGRLYTLMGKVKKAVGPSVSDVTFHVFCHTWAMWMRRYAGADTHGLL